jgi:glycosyltransferase involved in cell wall biosynthesis
MRVLVWHVHGSWLTSLVQGSHDYLLPVLPDRGPDGRGLAQTFSWPERVREVTPAELGDTRFDVVVLQRPVELDLLRRWSGRPAGAGGIPAVYVEHNTPRGDVHEWRHPLSARDDIAVVHVTEWNRIMWDNGRAPARVVEHGVPDYGNRYTGRLDSLAVCVNEPVRRRRVAGTDVAARVAAEYPVTFFGIGTERIGELVRSGLAGHDNLSQDELHVRLPDHLAYLHPYRWTSLGLSLVEAMTLGMPVLALAATAAPESVPPQAGLVSSDPGALAAMARHWREDRDEARAVGEAARAHALRRFGLGRFLDEWDHVFKEVTR